jgi:HlyD family secretion protein
VKDKLARTLPIYEDQERSWAKLHQEGFAGWLLAEERRRQRIEAEQELKAQTHAIEGTKATIEQSAQRLAQITSNYRQQLMTERVEVGAALHKLTQEADKQDRRSALLELKAPQAGIVKELATHTTGAVLQPGTVLMTLVPSDEQLLAEVWVDNQDIGFVRVGQDVKLKLATYPFQKYGMVDGTVRQVGADASEPGQMGGNTGQKWADGKPEGARYRFRALVTLAAQGLTNGELRQTLSPGMQVQAEIKLGERTVLEYLLSPVQRAWKEAGRER